MAMQQLAGSAAFSGFKLEKLTEAVKRACPKVQCLTANWLHLVEHDSELTPQQQHVLEALLDYGVGASRTRGRYGLVGNAQVRHRIPRGHQRPTDIAHICELPVTRLERGRQFVFDCVTQPSEAEWRDIVGLIHDRMTESVLWAAPSEADLAGSVSEKALTTVPLMGGGREALRVADTELGLALSEEEMDYLLTQFRRTGQGSHGRRVNDVRPGQLGALPAQDF